MAHAIAVPKVDPEPALKTLADRIFFFWDDRNEQSETQKREVVNQSTTDTHARMPLPRILPEQFRQGRWLSTCPTPSCALCQKVPPARKPKAREHAVDHIRVHRLSHTSAGRKPHARGNLSGFGERQLSHEVHGFTAPPAARFNGQDNEPAPPCQQFALRASADGIQLKVETAPRFSSQNIGAVGRAQDAVEGQIRCLRLELETRLSMEVTPAMDIRPWLVRHAGWLLERYHV